MSNKLLKEVHLVTENFKPDAKGKGYEHNGVKLDILADFYEVSEKEKETLFSVTKGFNDLSQKMIKKELSVPEYFKEVESLNQLTKSIPNINIGMNNKNVFVISLKVELKEKYQTENQLTKTKEVKTVTKKPSIFALYGIEWEESERGWGVRPDGYSFHRTNEEAEQYVKDFIARQPKEVPDEYSRPSGKQKLIEVSEGLYDYVMENGSVWLIPKNEEAYKTYDASHLKKPKNKM